MFPGLREVWVSLSLANGGVHLVVLAHSQARRDSALFEKIKCIFSIAPVGIFSEVTGVFLSWKHSPDAQRGGTGRWPLASGVLSGAAECTGRIGVSPVLSVRCEGFLQPSLRTSPVSTGPSGGAVSGASAW